MKWLILLLLLGVPGVLACQQTYFPGGDVVLSNVIVSDGVGAVCNVSIYTRGFLNQSGLMVNVSVLGYEYNASKLGFGRDYQAVFECAQGNSTYYDSCSFMVGAGDDGMLGFVVLIPILIAALLIVVASLLSPDHNVLKWGMMMASLFFTIVSVNWGATSIAYLFGMSELVGQLGEFTFQFGLFLFFIMGYFMVWFIIQIFRNMAERKQEKLRY